MYKNKFGVIDLIGNVRQWTLNQTDTRTDARNFRAVCGTSWDFVQEHNDEHGVDVPALVSGSIDTYEIDRGSDQIGFRLVHHPKAANLKQVQSVGIQLVGLLDEPIITVNGRGYQSKEITLATTKPVKSFVIKVEHYGWDTFETTVDVPAGTITKVAVKPTGSKRASLHITGTPPDAQIFVGDKQLAGTTYTEFPVTLPKSVEVRVYASGFRHKRQLVKLVGGTTNNFEVMLQRLPSRTLAQCPRLQSYLKSLCLIPSGQFQMGNNAGAYDEKPPHAVQLSSFRIGKTPVTYALWKEYCEATGTLALPAPDWGNLDTHPVVGVSWNDIMGSDGKGGFCAWASDVAGVKVTLPTEAQWEYAAIGGETRKEFPWGNKFDDSKLWCSTVKTRSRTAPVSRSINIYRNAYGLTDLVGNVWQWCSDLYGPYTSQQQRDPVGPSATPDDDRCVRGGAWSIFIPDNFRCTNRQWFDRNYREDTIGFRITAGPG
jgi:formylglycine-generating enzyme required for sulfatase activity